MNMKILADISRYLEFLQSGGILISLSALHPRFEDLKNQIFPYKYHLHPVCAHMKSGISSSSGCVQNIRSLQQQNLCQSTYCCCYAGVEEWVVPLLYRQERLAYVHVSGFRGQLAAGRQRRAKIRAERGEELGCLYDQLSDRVPSREEILTFVQPLQYMFEALYHACEQTQPPVPYGRRELYLRAMNYIHQKYMNHLTIEELANMLKCSPSYLRGMFQKEAGTTVHAVIRRVRLERAEKLLRATSLSVTQIATRTGFPDSNYFSVAFKKHYGRSPTQYRAGEKKPED